MKVFTRHQGAGGPPGLTLLASLDTGESDYTGGHIAIEGNYLYLIINNGTSPYPHFYVINISNKISPSIVGSVTLSHSMTYNGIVAENHVVYAPYGGMIIDVSDPANPTELGSHLLSSNLCAWESGGHHYVAGGFAAPGNDPFQIWNVDNPSAPVLEGQTAVRPFYSDWITRLGGYAYLPSYNNLGFDVIDISNVALPTYVRAVATPSYFFGPVPASGNRLYAHNLWSPSTHLTWLYDLTDPSNPVYVDAVPVVLYCPEADSAQGYFFTASYDSVPAGDFAIVFDGASKLAGASSNADYDAWDTKASGSYMYVIAEAEPYSWNLALLIYQFSSGGGQPIHH